MDTLFAVKSKQFAVFCDADGSVTWSDYDGNKVMAAFPLEGGSRCVVLLHPDASEKARFENLFCVDHDGASLVRSSSSSGNLSGRINVIGNFMWRRASSE